MDFEDDTYTKREKEDHPLTRTVYLVNSTPKYYYLLPLHFAMLRRYNVLKSELMAIVLATEVPEHPTVQQVARDYGVEVLPIPVEESGFLDSRAAALRALAAAAPQRGWEFVLPVQEDFLVDREAGLLNVERASWAPFCYLRAGKGVASVRLMPCPGPAVQSNEKANYFDLSQTHDTYGFTFQATLWRLEDCAAWYAHLSEQLEKAWPRATTAPAKRIEMEVRANFAENADGQRLFWAWSSAQRDGRGVRHMAHRRVGPWSNAVYLCPWPYRPTAIVKGKLEPWAEELGRREGFSLRPGIDVKSAPV